jgi:peptidoglycan hydrolase CwlO-like protein
MIDQVTSGGEPSLADLILEQIAQAEQVFKQEMGNMQAELRRLSGELNALNKELQVLLAEPGDHQKEIAEVEQKMAETKSAIDTLTDSIKARNEKYQAEISLLTAALNELDQIIKDEADKIGR